MTDSLMDRPDSSEVFCAAVRAFDARDWTQAEALCEQLLLCDRQHADALQLLGLVFRETGRLDAAIRALRDAAEHDPHCAMLATNLGVTYYRARQFALAAESLQRAISLNADLPEAHYNLSLAYHGLGEFDSAVAAALRATELRRGYTKAHYQLGNLLRAQGRFEEAVAAYQATLRLRPDWVDARCVLGVVWLQLDEPAQAVEQFREALRLDPACNAAKHSMAAALHACGRFAEAKAVHASAWSGSDGLSVLARESRVELIAPDRRAIEEHFARITRAVEAFSADPGEFSLSNPYAYTAALPSGALVYYGGNLRSIMERYAKAIGPHISRIPLRARRGKPKLGIVATNRHAAIFARSWGEIARRLSRELFDVTLICSQDGADTLQAMLCIPERECLRLPGTIEECARLLYEQEFDWLHYWEIGTDWINYYLPFFKTAPGQSNGWGWPVTSGNPCVNSYLSCVQLESADAAAHYTEQLVRLKHLPTYYVPTPVPNVMVQRRRFGLEAHEHVYLCSQRSTKYHPDFDSVLATLLRRDPRGLFLMIAHPHASITDLLLDRFYRAMPDVLPRIRVVPRMERDEYLGLLTVADVSLDTLHYGGGANTVYDAVAVGTPMVTLPDEFHRSRWAAAVNRRLGLEQLIAGTPEEYVAKAIEVASNPDLRQALHRQILEAGAELFEDAAVVREHEEYFRQAIAATRVKREG